VAGRLISRLENTNARVRERAAWLLGTTGDRRAIEPLIGLLDDENQGVRTSAAHALQTLTDQDFGTDAARWRQWWQKHR
jgi:HEAT repeat protein